MSESSAEVRLQVVHPVPAFFVCQKIFLKLYSKMPLRIPISIGTSQKWKAARGILDSRFKKTGESETIFAAFFSSPGAERQKGGQNAYIEKGQRTGRTSLYCGLYAYLRCQ